MATKSIYKTICIKDSKTARRFVCALDKAKAKHIKPVQYSRPCSYATEDEIRSMFGKKA